MGLIGKLELVWNHAAAQALGKIVRELRVTQGLSQERLAHEAGITKNQLQLIEAGRSSGRKVAVGPSNPQMSTLVGLAGALDTSVADILTRAEI